MIRLGVVAGVVALAACGSQGPGSTDQAPAAPAADAGLGPLVLLPIDPDPDFLPVVRGSIEGRPARLLIDTGASATIVSASFIGAPTDQGTRVQSLCLGSLCWPQLGVWAADTRFSSPDPAGIQAVVGMSPLGSYVVDLDRGRTLTLWTRPPGGDAGCGGWQGLQADSDGRPLLTMGIDQQPPVLALLDTGARYTLLDGSQVGGYLQEGATETGACSLQGCTTMGSWVSTARRVCAGDHCLDDVEVKFPAWNAIGGTFLRRVRMIADLPGQRLRFCAGD